MRRFLRIAALTLLAVLSPAMAQAGPGTLAILYFDNQGNPELEPLKVGLAQMLITDLRGTPGVTVIERAHLQDLLDELEMGHSGVTDPETAAKLGKLLGAEWMLLGSYFELLGTLRIDARLVKVETGEIQHAHGVNDTSRAFMDMEKSIAGSFRSHLEKQAAAGPAVDGPTGFADSGGEGGGGGDALADGGQDDAPRTRGGDGEAVPEIVPEPCPPEVVHPDTEVLQSAMSFSEGLIHLDRSDVPRARESFQQALAANPHLDAAREALATLDI